MNQISSLPCSSQFKGKGQGAQFDAHGSVHRGELSPVSRPSRAVTLGAQLIKDIQHGLFARVHEGAAGDVLGVLEKLFGFGEFVHAASLPSGPFQGIPFLLSSHDSH